MRKFGLAVGIVFSAAMILGAAYAGTFLAGGPVEDLTLAPRAKQRAVARHHRRVRHKHRLRAARAEWADGADVACARARREAKALVRRASRGRRSQRRLVLNILGGGLQIQGRLLARLRALKPRADERGDVAQALAILAREQRSDTVLLAKLRRRWDKKLLARQLVRDRRWNARLQLHFTALGAFTCVKLV